MRIKTATIGAFPKPSCTPIGDWFPDAEDENAKGADRGLLQRWSITEYEEKLEEAGENAETAFLNAIHEVLDDQIQAGIDICSIPVLSTIIEKNASAKSLPFKFSNRNVITPSTSSGTSNSII